MISKNCSSCGIEKEESCFNKNKSSSDGLQVYCKDCMREKVSDWRKRNPHKMKGYNKKYYHQDPIKARERVKKYYRDNTEKVIGSGKEWKGKNPDKVKQHKKNDYIRHSASYKERAMRRHCKKLNATPPWFDKELVELIYQECPEGYEVDHIIPLQGETVSGLHTHQNLQYLPMSENRRKHNKLLEQ